MRATAPFLLFFLSGVLVTTAATDATDPTTRPAAPVAPAPAVADHLLFVTTDGFRWQELFRGADEPLLAAKAGGVREAAGPLRERFVRPTPGEARAALLPFVWGTVAARGQVIGNRDKNAPAAVANHRHFSYPGYSEFLTGIPDDQFKSNDPVLNPHPNVLEVLSRRPGFEGRVAAFASWDVLHAILAADRNKLPVWTQKTRTPDPGPIRRDVERLIDTTPTPWPDETFDSFTFRCALEHLQTKKPRVLYVCFGDTDEWAHARRYDNYLRSAANSDRFVAELWAAAQAMPEYAGRTALVLTTDHGRGRTGGDWVSHSADVPGSDETWVALMGPGVPPLGERRDAPTVWTGQVAATVAKLVGVDDYAAAVPGALKPIDGVGATAAAVGR
ncbi:MAG: Type phosphodiesterase / nucleotide pyrophosphatase [Phycisphaerales bacterium]|nr:Type phosphodiesterase / nucleotide pyrophosphatase [Phycisphaerales bacterium]